MNSADAARRDLGEAYSETVKDISRNCGRDIGEAFGNAAIVQYLCADAAVQIRDVAKAVRGRNFSDEELSKLCDSAVARFNEEARKVSATIFDRSIKKTLNPFAEKYSLSNFSEPMALLLALRASSVLRARGE
jgi:hypothetical protein